MKQIVSILLLGLLSGIAMASIEKFSVNVYFQNLTPNLQKVYYGEQIAIPFTMYYSNLKGYQTWTFPPNVAIQNNTPFSCPPSTNGFVNLEEGVCYFSVIVHGNQVGRITKGGIYYIFGKNKKASWELPLSLYYSVLVIPHPLSMANIPVQTATANLPVNINLKPYVNYYDENVLAGALPVADLLPAQLDGLYYDPVRFAIMGVPTRVGTYQFSLGVGNANGNASPINLTVEVGVNQRDKPVFKTHYPIASAVPGETYQLNLMDFIEAKEKFGQNNPLHFRIDLNESHPSWLKIDGKDKTLLSGDVPLSEAGLKEEVSIIASSNTGGDSRPLKIYISIARDSASKPSISPFSLEKPAGIEFEYDVHKHIFDPAKDESLRLVIDKVEPEATWLRVSSINPTTLIGTVPLDATGQVLQLSLHANTRTGGNSDEIKVLLSIAVDKEKAPRFKAANPQLPLFYPGTPFDYDFVANNDIYPDYEVAPYTVELAAGYGNPFWLAIENNKLIADAVPEIITKSSYQIYLRIKNVPGGKSEVVSITLHVMH
ncbi:MAG: hypothetical protein H0T84_13200 [Tatlockia sp.]|nr:hypothetical protein [Tatlockia sp.]